MDMALTESGNMFSGKKKNLTIVTSSKVVTVDIIALNTSINVVVSDIIASIASLSTREIVKTIRELIKTKTTKIIPTKTVSSSTSSIVKTIISISNTSIKVISIAWVKSIIGVSIISINVVVSTRWWNVCSFKISR